jgi:hypothetical protein
MEFCRNFPKFNKREQAGVQLHFGENVLYGAQNVLYGALKTFNTPLLLHLLILNFVKNSVKAI